jgi:tetratricopeptide (TPR) repeat protein
MIRIHLILLSATVLFASCGPAADSDRKRAVDLNNQAVSLVTSGNLDSATVLLNAAIRADSTYPLTYINLSSTQVRQGRFYQALQSAKSALRVKPDHAEAALLAAILSQRDGDTSSSKEYLRVAVSLFDKRVSKRDSCDTRANRAYAYLWSGQDSLAWIDITWLRTASCDSAVIHDLENFNKSDILKSLTH